MFLNGLNNIDFQGSLCGLGDTRLSAQDAASIAWDNATGASWSGITENEFKQSIYDALGNKYALVQSSQMPTNAVNNQDIIDGFLVKNPGQNTKALFLKNIVLSNLNDKGYYVVTLTQAPLQQIPIVQAKPIVASSGGGFWDTLKSFPKTVQDTLTNISSNVSSGNVTAGGQNQQGPAQPTGGGVKRQSDNPIIYQTRTKKLSAVEKKRLMWIIGIGGALFVVTLGIVASRD